MYLLVNIIRETLRAFLSAAPFLLFGFFLAGMLHVLIPSRWLTAAMGKRDFRSVLLASLTGIPLPLCSCSVLPAAVEARKAGASAGATASFVTSTPQTGIDSISLTYAMMDPIMTVARPLAALGTALAAGAAVNAFDREPADHAAERERAEKIVLTGGGPEPVLTTAPEKGRLRAIFSYAYGELLDDIASWFIIGMLLTGLIGALVPAGAFRNPTISGFPAMLAMLIIGIPLYVCAVSSTPMAAMLILKGLSPGTAMVFLLAGPATNATSITVLLKLLGRRVVLIYLASIAIFSLLAGLLIDGIYAASGIDAMAVAGSASELIPRWFEAPAALLLFALLIRSAIRTDMLRAWRRGLQRLGRPLHVDFGGRAMVTLYVIIVTGLYLLTGCSMLGPGETGWVLSFGKVVRTLEEPGLILHAPYPFASVQKVATDRIRSIDRGFRQGQSMGQTHDRYGAARAERELVREAEIATGDENLLTIRYSIQYSIRDAYAYHFALDDPEALVTNLAEYSLRAILSHEMTDSILVNNRPRISAAVGTTLRRELDALDAGIAILRVDLLDIHAPTEVHYAFRDIASAMEDQHRFLRQAESYRMRVIASARAQAFKSSSNARGEKELAVAQAHGKARSFTALVDATRGERPLARTRMFLDSAARVLPRARVILPLTDLPIDLWVREPGASKASPGIDVPSPAPQWPAESNTAPAETWREKMNRLEERDR